MHWRSARGLFSGEDVSCIQPHLLIQALDMNAIQGHEDDAGLLLAVLVDELEVEVVEHRLDLSKQFDLALELDEGRWHPCSNLR